MKDHHCEVIAILIILLLAAVGHGLYGAAFYDDWTCGFTKCVKVKP